MQKQIYEYISENNSDPIVERRTCKISGQEFPVYQSDKEFYHQASPKIGEQTFQIPFPNLCPQERERRRLAWRNERHLYRRKCDITGKDIISIYSPDKPNKVCDEKVWWTGEVEMTDYGQDFDFSRTFFQQFDELYQRVPLPSLHVVSNENSIINQCGYSKKCYLCFNADYDEECYYCTNTIYSKNCMDMLNAEHCEVCAYSVDIKKSYKVFFSHTIQDSNNIYFSEDLQGCSFCFGCKHLQNKQYCFFNKQLTKEEYEQEIGKYNLSDNTIHEQLKPKLQAFFDSFPKEACIIKHSEKAYGNHINNAQGAKICFDCFDVHDISYCGVTSYLKTSMDFNIGGYDCELCLDVVSSGDKNYRCLFCANVWGSSQDMYYCSIAKDCKNCFGCVGLHNKQYCILNKQYTKEEYEQIVPKIIEHMKRTPLSPLMKRGDVTERGEFFPVEISPFGYNETVAQEYYPLNQEDAKNKGYSRKIEDNNISIPEGVEKIKGERIKEMNDEVILKSAIVCDVSGRPFKIIQQELAFYRKNNLPLPTKHPDVRHQERVDMRGERNLYLRTCDKTGKETLSVYPQDVSFNVYSQEVYEKEVY